ncbi:MAG: DUF3347 domain-containing protein [Bacteroidota bacterium]|nr:DUF3347 domain-containing protein [Bacteroidota bacterium]
MKKIKMIISAGIIALSFTACNTAGSKQTNNTDSAQTGQVTMPANNTNPAEGIVTGYLNLKNSLADDNGSAAAKNGKEILDALSKFDASRLTPDQKKVFLGLVGDIKENSEHISENGDKIAHQREHFEMLSKDMYDLLKATGTSKEMYLDSCPMYDNGKGTWLSEMKEIKNPYLGKKMDTCGAVKETIK